MGSGERLWWWERSLWRHCWAWCEWNTMGSELAREDAIMTHLGSANGEGRISGLITYFPAKGDRKGEERRRVTCQQQQTAMSRQLLAWETEERKLQSVYGTSPQHTFTAHKRRRYLPPPHRPCTTNYRPLPQEAPQVSASSHRQHVHHAENGRRGKRHSPGLQANSGTRRT